MQSPATSPTSKSKKPPLSGLVRFFSGLRPSKAGPLPVQIGFPTSLADLVVKNHDRLKKPPKPKKNRRPNTATSPPKPASPAAPAPPPVIERSDLGPICQASVPKAATFRIGSEFVGCVLVLVLLFLAIWSKKLVFGITAVASVMLILDLVKVKELLLHLLKPCPEARPKLDLAIGRGFVSPIREAVSEFDVQTPRLDSVVSLKSDTNTDASVSSERSESFDSDERSLSNSGSTKSKKIWKRVFSSKKLSKSSRSLDFDASENGEVKRQDEEALDMVSNAVGSMRVSRSCESLRSVAEERVSESSRGEEDSSPNGGALQMLVFVAVVLLGLTGGKVVAVVVTMLCCVLLSSSGAKVVRSDSVRRIGSLR